MTSDLRQTHIIAHVGLGWRFEETSDSFFFRWLIHDLWTWTQLPVRLLKYRSQASQSLGHHKQRVCVWGGGVYLLEPFTDVLMRAAWHLERACRCNILAVDLGPSRHTAARPRARPVRVSVVVCTARHRACRIDYVRLGPVPFRSGQPGPIGGRRRLS